MFVVLQYLRLQHEFEVVVIRADSVFRQKVGTAALGADSGQLMVYAQDRAAAGLQLIVVRFLFQFFLCEDRDVEGKGPVRYTAL